MNTQDKKFDKDTQKFIDTKLDRLSEIAKEQKKLKMKEYKMELKLKAQLDLLKALDNPTPQELEDIAALEKLGIANVTPRPTKNVGKWVIQRTANAKQKHESIKIQFKQLSEGGMLYENCISELSKKFYLAKCTIEHILNY